MKAANNEMKDRKSSETTEKGGNAHMRTKKRRLLTLAAAAGLCALSFGKAWAANPVDATITVTPIATVNLSLAPTYYVFGSMNVNTSSNSATAIVLTNNGSVNVSVDKTMVDDAAWVIDTTTGTTDHFVLACATAAARASATSFPNGTRFSTTLSTYNPLTGTDGTSTQNIAPAGSVNLWFRLDMPSAVSSQAQQTFTVRFQGTAQ
jgi:hypothetical protein